MLKPALPPQALRGFNLIEAAIVLAVVGLVIGGIWYAAATVRENRRVAELRTVLAAIHTRTQQLYGTSIVATGNTTLTSNARDMGLLTNDWVYQSSGYYINPSGDQVQLILTNPGCANAGAAIAVRLLTSVAICTKVIAGLGPTNSGVAGYYWTTQAACDSTASGGLSLAAAQARCAANTQFSIQMPLGSSPN